MAVIYTPISLDTVRPNFLVPFIAKEKDVNSRYLSVQLTNNGSPVVIASGNSVRGNFVNAAGEATQTTGSANADGTVTVPVPGAGFLMNGPMRCSVTVIGTGASEKLTTAGFDMYVETMEPDGDEYTAGNYASYRDQLDQHFAQLSANFSSQLSQTTGQRTDVAMSQKAVTDKLTEIAAAGVSADNLFIRDPIWQLVQYCIQHSLYATQAEAQQALTLYNAASSYIGGHWIVSTAPSPVDPTPGDTTPTVNVPATKTVTAGSEVTIYATGTMPSNSLTWAITSGSAYASFVGSYTNVNSVTLSGTAAGTVTVSCSYNGQVMGNCTVTVSAAQGGGDTPTSILNTQVASGASASIGQTLALADSGKNYTIVFIPQDPSSLVQGSRVALINGTSNLGACTMSITGGIYNLAVNYNRSTDGYPTYGTKAYPGQYTCASDTTPAFFFWELPPAAVDVGATYNQMLWGLHVYLANGSEVSLSETLSGNTGYAWLSSEKNSSGYTHPDTIVSTNNACRFLVFDKILTSDERASIVANVTYANGGNV